MLSEHSGAPRLQEAGEEAHLCSLQALPRLPPSPASGDLAYSRGKARPGTSPVQLASSPCGVCPQLERGLCPVGQFESESK